MRTTPTPQAEMYRSGDIRHLDDGDPEHADLSSAEREAVALSLREPEAFIGVWSGANDGSELLVIVHGGTTYRAR
jgi:hypothetical protein